MPVDPLTIINQVGLPMAIIIGLWYVLRHVEGRNAEKDKLIYDILKEGQTRVESLVKMVLDLSREDANTRAELRAAIDTLTEALARMQDFCGRQRPHG